MSVDILQEKIRKTKNPSVLELAMPLCDLPPQFSQDAGGFAAFSRELLQGLKGIVPAIRVSFSFFALLGPLGLQTMGDIMSLAKAEGYYVLLDAPEILSPMMAKQTADLLLGENALYPCDGLVICAYLGSDVIKPFVPYCKKAQKDIFVVTRTANKSAPELQDLLCGSRLVHMAAADHVSRYGADVLGKCGYSRIGILAAASAANSLRSLRSKYPGIFMLLDGFDYPNANAKNCSHAFDKYGHGAAACAGTDITCAWKNAESDGSDFVEHARAAAERMKKNLTRYITVL